ncbi:NAD(P)H-dependent oxidoreductase subunit E [Patulibacter sp. SYSU D01012]|uniref:NADH-quinone oxidoreductase subunit NuoE family protein n=1 Tax=Patulibacter sp. SYSU D01012 TaxID=2817381 RepID=UPI001FEF05D1|nr:NAD(P)H-dependent oxidoreductase subunit E [Patulibacter sp. SYSU D01012]
MMRFIRRDPLGPLDREAVRHGEERPAGPPRALSPEADPEVLHRDVPRFAHGLRTPGLHEATDPTKDPAGIPDPAVVEVPDALRAEIEDYMSRYPDFRSAAIPALAAAQKVHGWCSPTAIEQVACVMRLTPAYLTAVAGFYDMLETKPVGRKTVYVCTNISCSLRGGDELLAALEARVGDDPDVNIRGFECLGACDIAPMASIDGVYVGPVEDHEVVELAEQILSGAEPLPGKQLVRRRVADAAANTDDVVRASTETGTLDPVRYDGAGDAPTQPGGAA